MSIPDALITLAEFDRMQPHEVCERDRERACRAARRLSNPDGSAATDLGPRIEAMRALMVGYVLDGEV